MAKRWIAVALSVVSCAASAQFKCVGSDGAVSFQQMPCAGAGAKQELLTVRPASGRAPAQASAMTEANSSPSASPNADVRLAAKMERERKTLEMQRRIANVESDIDRRNGLMQEEMDSIRSRKSSAKNNLAGATWEQSLSGEMQAVAAKYKAMNDVDMDRLKQMRQELAAMQM